jgi:hypothetical protein
VIRIERDPRFWTAVAAHPAVSGAVLGLAPERIGELAARPDMLPLAATHGGFLFARMDAMGFVAELHTLFTPEGWGREAMTAGVMALNALWLTGYQVLTTFEVEANRMSRPPITFGFQRAGDWRETPVGRLRMWILTRAGWEASPASTRRRRCLQ